MLSAASPTDTNHYDSSKLEEATWESFKTKRTNAELYEENAVVMFVPTSVGARGSANIRRFFLNPQFAEKNVAIQEEIHNTILSNHRLIEESVWIVHFYTSECNWLVPQIEDRHLVDAIIQFPMITSVTFNENNHKIDSIRYSWDQAGVLKQLKVISEKVNWPIVGDQQIESLRSLHTVRLKDLNGEFIGADNEKASALPQQQSNQFTPGRIFGPVDPKDQVKTPVRRQEPTAPPARNIFTYQPPPERRLVAPSNKWNTSFSFAHDDGTSDTLVSKMSETAISQNHNRPPAGKPTPRIVHNIIG